MKSKIIAPLFLCSTLFAQEALLNQVGYEPTASKKVILRGKQFSSVTVKDSQGTTVATINPSAPAFYDLANDTTQILDLTTIQNSGTYSLYDQNNQLISNEFQVLENAYLDAFKKGIRFYYYQRSSTALPAEFAGEWAREAGHPDTSVYYHPDTGVTDPEYRPSPKGWYDAGDYGKYVVNSGISTYTLLDLYETYPTYFDTLTWNIPESSNNIPDLLDEIRWNLDWLLTTQHWDGGVFHKVTTKYFVGMVEPSKASGKRYFMPQSTAATLDFAAVMAKAARIYLPYDPDFAKECAMRAKHAWEWARINWDLPFTNPKGVSTGGYGDQNFTDEEAWAGAELYLLTQDSTYLSTLHSIQSHGKVPGWAKVGALGIFTILANKDHFPADIVALAQEGFDTNYEKLVTTFESSPYLIAMAKQDFFWGSNGQVGNQGYYALLNFLHTGDSTSLTIATEQLSYLLGKNPLNLSFATGTGLRSPHDPHHRPSEGDAVVEPVPGMLVGGPHAQGNDVGSCGNYITYPAVSYIDDRCSFATNEVTINWNAPYAFLSGALTALHRGIPAWEKRFPPFTAAELDALPTPVKAVKNPVATFGLKGRTLLLENANLEDLKVEAYDLRGALLGSWNFSSNDGSQLQINLDSKGNGHIILKLQSPAAVSIHTLQLH